MAQHGKKWQSAVTKVDQKTFFSMEEAIALAQKSSYSKFNGSIDIAIKLNLDVKKSEQQLRGSAVLPHGTGKTTRVLVAVEDVKLAEAAKKAGADHVMNKEDLTTLFQKGKLDFDVLVAHPELMPFLGRYGKTLGPKGLMPNPKMGTVQTDPASIVAELKKGKANYRTDKSGIIHAAIGKVKFKTNDLAENARVLINTLKSVRPPAVKGAYIQTISVSASMGPSVKVKIEN